MTIRVSGESPAAAPALAGMEIGWGQSLDTLEAVLAASAETDGRDPAAPALSAGAGGRVGHTRACEREDRPLETTNPVAAPSAASRAALGRT